MTDLARRRRSLQFCHYPAVQRPLASPPSQTQGYTPELSTGLEIDRNLSDGARRCARILAGYVYRRNRDTRTTHITVTYLMKSMRRCRRSVQRYLRQLEAAGYIEADVLAGPTRMAMGLRIKLLAPLFPTHARAKWPAFSGAPPKSHKQRFLIKTVPIPRKDWALRCMDGVFRSLMSTIPPLPA